MRAIIFDVDNTLAVPRDPAFYAWYSQKTEQAIALHYRVSPVKAGKVAGAYRRLYGGAEQALFRGNVHKHFPDIAPRLPDFTVLYDLMCRIDPRARFQPQTELRASLAQMRRAGVRIVALTSSPDRLSEAILRDSGFEVVTDFDLFMSYERHTGPPKMVDAEKAFISLAEQLDIPPKYILAVGDTLDHDVLPAEAVGMIGCLLSNRPPANWQGLTADSAAQIVAAVADATREKVIPKEQP